MASAADTETAGERDGDEARGGDPIVVLNGPNLNLLGVREPDVYGRDTLQDIETRMAAAAARRGLALDFRQSNHEGVLIDWIHETGVGPAAAAALIINPGAYTHTSIALHDALKAVAIPKIELHLSNVQAREPFRRRSYVAQACDGVIGGFGADGYLLALDAAARLIEKRG